MIARLRATVIRIIVVLGIAIAGVCVAQSPYTQGGNNNVFIGGSPIGDPYATNGTLYPGTGYGLFPGFSIPTVSDRLWVRAEYLGWFADGLQTPPLVTSSNAGTPANQAGIQGQPNTAILFGGNELNTEIGHGVRLRAGLWLTPQGTWGIEGEYFQLDGDNESFLARGEGEPILARPFFDTASGLAASQLISYPALTHGGVGVTTDSTLKSALLNARASLIPLCPSVCAPDAQQDRIDWVIGYRYLELDEFLAVAERRQSQVGVDPATTSVFDRFETENQFNGLQLGVIHQANFRRAWLESMLRVAIGNNTQRVRLIGGSSITDSTGTTNQPGGLLVQPGSMGNWEQEDFTMIPEIGFTFGYRFTSCLHASIGYTLLYFPNVVRPGDQIDRTVNGITGATFNASSIAQSDYWAQGISLGAELRF